MLRKWAITAWLLCCASFVAADVYRPDEVPNVQLANKERYVSNPDGILSDGAVARIDSICASMREKGLAQIAVVAVDAIEGDDAFTFAVELFRSWGVGDARNDNGLGILLVEELHEIRFVTGGGLEGVLPDAICKRIQMQFMVPAFQNDDYDLGMTAGVEAVAIVLEKGGEALPEDTASEEDLTGWEILLLILLVVGCPLGFVLLIYWLKSYCPKCHRMALRQQAAHQIRETANYCEMEYTYVCSHCGHVLKRRSRHYKDHNDTGATGGGFLGGTLHGGGMFRGGSSGGGSFGGGSFGGGGAGSKW